MPNHCDHTTTDICDVCLYKMLIAMEMEDGEVAESEALLEVE